MALGGGLVVPCKRTLRPPAREIFFWNVLSGEFYITKPTAMNRGGGDSRASKGLPAYRDQPEEEVGLDVASMSERFEPSKRFAKTANYP
jgi:hypothetical protein